MKPKKNKSKICHKYLPPHSWEAHPSANQGEANKQLIIAVITIGAIIILGALLLFSEQIVGKAFFVPGGKFTAGIVEPTSPIIENTPFSLVIKANIDTKETVAIEFKLELPGGVPCQFVEVGVPDLLNWNEAGLVFDISECIGNQIVFKFATLNYNEAKSGEFEVAQLNFKNGAPAGKYKLEFESFNIYDLNDKENIDLIENGETADILVEEKEDKDCVGGKSNGKPDIGENCLTCPADVSCKAGETCEAGMCKPELLVCTPNEYSCSDDKTVVRCNPDGKAYTKIADCADNQLCEEGECVEVVEPVCTASEYFCFNLTQVARCDSDGMNSTLQAACKEDEACSAGVCVKKAPLPPVCMDPDLLDYQKKGITTDNTITLTDECSSPEILKEGKCLDKEAVYVDVDCPENFGDDFACNEGTCIFKSKIKPMKVELLKSTGIAVAATDTLSLGGDYKVKVTVSPLDKDLGKHILIAQVAYNNQSNTYIYENKGNLSIDEEETIEFVHKLANKGELKIEAFVWGNWPSTGTGNALLEKVEVKYEIK